MINDMKLGWFKVPEKVEQMNAYLFSDTIKINKHKKLPMHSLSRAD
jgi:hypothetical protein